MMDFCALVTRLLQDDVQGRRRRLHLRTYAVVCLNANSGLLEWVPNTTGLRVAIDAAYTAHGVAEPMAITMLMRQTFEGTRTHVEELWRGRAALRRSPAAPPSDRVLARYCIVRP